MAPGRGVPQGESGESAKGRVFLLFWLRFKVTFWRDAAYTTMLMHLKSTIMMERVRYLTRSKGNGGKGWGN